MAVRQVVEIAKGALAMVRSGCGVKYDLPDSRGYDGAVCCRLFRVQRSCISMHSRADPFRMDCELRGFSAVAVLYGQLRDAVLPGARIMDICRDGRLLPSASRAAADCQCRCVAEMSSAAVLSAVGASAAPVESGRICRMYWGRMVPGCDSRDVPFDGLWAERALRNEGR